MGRGSREEMGRGGSSVASRIDPAFSPPSFAGFLGSDLRDPPLAFDVVVLQFLAETGRADYGSLGSQKCSHFVLIR